MKTFQIYDLIKRTFMALWGLLMPGLTQSQAVVLTTATCPGSAFHTGEITWLVAVYVSRCPNKVRKTCQITTLRSQLC
jgi:hypothetical protein